MGWLIDKIRECFCKHEWELVFVDEGRDRTFNTKYSHRIYKCQKCGKVKEYHFD